MSYSVFAQGHPVPSVDPGTAPGLNRKLPEFDNAEYLNGNYRSDIQR
jgi:hypothetical protein